MIMGGCDSGGGAVHWCMSGYEWFLLLFAGQPLLPVCEFMSDWVTVDLCCKAL